MLSYMKYFYQVAVSGNFSRAAKELFISQPALSKQIAALEEYLGLRLFYRQERKPELTDSGRRLFSYVEQNNGVKPRSSKRNSGIKRPHHRRIDH